MTTFVTLSSLTALVGILIVGITVRRTLARLAIMDQQRGQAVERAEVLLVALTPIMASARACILPCPACDLDSDEPCLCETRRRSLASSVTAAESAIELALSTTLRSACSAPKDD